MGMISKCFYAAKSLLKVTVYKLRCPHFKCGKLPYFNGKTFFTFRRSSRVTLGDYVRMSDGGRLAATENAELVIKDGVRINVGNIIYSHEKIVIGEQTQIGPYCQFYDHDHRFDTVDAFDNQEYLTAPIEIGAHCWFGSNCVILRGTKIGDNCVIAAGTIVKGTYPDNSMIYNKRETVVKSIVRSKKN